MIRINRASARKEEPCSSTLSRSLAVTVMPELGGGGNQLLKIVVLSGRVPLCTLGIADYTGFSHLNTVVLNVSEDKSQYQFYLWYAERE